MLDLIKERPLQAAALFICAVMALTLAATFALDNKYATDFNVYWRTANEPFGMAYMAREKFPFPYAPTMLLWIIPLSQLPMWPAFVLWCALSILGLACACRGHLSNAEIGVVLASPPVVNCLFTGQARYWRP